MTQQRSGVSGLSGFSQSMSQNMDFSQDMHSAMRGMISRKKISVLISRNFSTFQDPLFKMVYCLKIQLTKVIEIPMLPMEVFYLNYDQKNHDTKYVEI